MGTEVRSMPHFKALPEFLVRPVPLCRKSVRRPRGRQNIMTAAYICGTATGGKTDAKP